MGQALLEEVLIEDGARGHQARSLSLLERGSSVLHVRNMYEWRRQLRAALLELRK